MKKIIIMVGIFLSLSANATNILDIFKLRDKSQPASQRAKVTTMPANGLGNPVDTDISGVWTGGSCDDDDTEIPNTLEIRTYDNFIVFKSDNSYEFSELGALKTKTEAGPYKTTSENEATYWNSDRSKLLFNSIDFQYNSPCKHCTNGEPQIMVVNGSGSLTIENGQLVFRVNWATVVNEGGYDFNASVKCTYNRSEK